MATASLLTKKMIYYILGCFSVPRTNFGSQTKNRQRKEKINGGTYHRMQAVQRNHDRAPAVQVPYHGADPRTRSDLPGVLEEERRRQNRLHG